MLFASNDLSASQWAAGRLEANHNDTIKDSAIGACLSNDCGGHGSSEAKRHSSIEMSAAGPGIPGLSGALFIFKNANATQVFEDNGPDWTEFDFSAIEPVASDFSWVTTREPPYRPWHDGPHHVTMGIKRTCFNDWCEIDESYRARYDYKTRLYRDHPEDTVCYVPGSDESCFEALHTLAEYLPRRYPGMFLKTANGIQNLVTGDDWDLQKGADTWNTYHPLQIMGLLSTEDWFVLQKNVADNDTTTSPTSAQLGNTYQLTAGANCFPAGWRLRERIGHTIAELHDNKVPYYAERLALSMHRFFNRLRVDQPHMRFNYAIDISGELFHINSHHNLDVSTLDHPVRLDDLHLRVERQVLQRLPKTKAIAFSIRTYVTPIAEVTKDKDVARALRTNTRSYKPEVAVYKNKSLWQDVLEEHLNQVLGPDEESES